MALEERTEMSRSSVDRLVERVETGVLSLAVEDEPYAIPVSYGYDPDDRTFYLRLVSAPDSDKRRFVSSNPEARLVIYEEEPPVYRSVIATGTMAEISTDELDVEHIEQFGDAKRPLFEIWAEPKPGLDVQLFELAPEELTGRRIVLDGE
ncbi:MAG: pyridoxamine 5'-phosphate oxidase family protein [Halobacteriales archaeon]